MPRQNRRTSDLPFLLSLGVLGGVYVVLIVAMLLADFEFTSPAHFWEALASPEIRYAIRLSLISCSITTILSLWVAVPLGYLMSRYRFRGKLLLDAVLDIPVVLPPLVIGLSLLILFQTSPGRALEHFTRHHMGSAITYGLIPVAAGIGLLILLRTVTWAAGSERRLPAVAVLLLGYAGALLTLAVSTLGEFIEGIAQERFATGITYAVPSVILAQFAVACAFSVRTMRVTFDEISPRQEQVALTLGCTRSQAFWLVVLPEARRGVVTAATLAWARSLGEFGPILIFSGSTRMKTEVLPTTVFLELSVGRIEAAVAVSMLMVLAAMLVLVIVRVFGTEAAVQKVR
jgi:molybdate transport system permease protein